MPSCNMSFLMGCANPDPTIEQGQAGYSTHLGSQNPSLPYPCQCPEQVWEHCNIFPPWNFSMYRYTREYQPGLLFLHWSSQQIPACLSAPNGTQLNLIAKWGSSIQGEVLVPYDQLGDLQGALWGWVSSGCRCTSVGWWFIGAYRGLGDCTTQIFLGIIMTIIEESLVNINQYNWRRISSFHETGCSQKVIHIAPLWQRELLGWSSAPNFSVIHDEQLKHLIRPMLKHVETLIFQRKMLMILRRECNV